MVYLTKSVLLFAAISVASPVESPLPPQHVLDVSRTRIQEGNPRKLHGKFLHITDVHPDPFYRQGSDSSGDSACHRDKGDAGYFGAEKTDCDTPFSLVNATFDWIKKNLKDEIDFVVWTGDSARHDNDEEHPRTNKQVEALNKYVVTKFDEVFGKQDNSDDPDPTNDFVIPIVPTYGNNDILPHNIFEPGPNKWTRKYLDIWEKFVPQEQRHTFARGGWFFTEVIPNKLAVFSLNTMYFFESNAAVDGCDADTEPGYEHFEWLRIQLEFLRRRKMKAILMGHVPPARTDSKQNWDETCYQKYTLWLRQYRDVVIGNLFGHMNIDHFTLQDVRELTYKFKIKGIDDEGLRDSGSSISTGFHAQAKPDYLNDLRERWGKLPTSPYDASYVDSEIGMEKSKRKKKKNKKKLEKFLREIGGPYGERFSLSFISPSVVPNYYPTLRVIEYNITGLEHDHPALVPTAPPESAFMDVELQQESNNQGTMDEDCEFEYDADDEFGAAKKKKKHKKKGRKAKKPNFPVPKPPSKSTVPGPGYSPQPLSFVSWTQLYANLTKINQAVAKEISANSELGADNGVHEDILKKHFTFEVEYSTKDDEVYAMKDLTMRSWLDYAEKAGRAKYSPKKHKVAPEFVGSKAADAVESRDEGEEDANSYIDRECLEYLRKLKEEALKVYAPWDDDPWPSSFLNKLNSELLFSRCLPGEGANIDLDEYNEEDPGYQSDTDIEKEIMDNDPTDSDSDEAQEEGEEQSDEDSPDSISTSKKKKKKDKKGKKKKASALKRNHLWHAFVRRAFVGTKTFEELRDEFG